MAAKYKQYTKEKERMILSLAGFTMVDKEVFTQVYNGQEFSIGDKVENYKDSAAYAEATKLFNQLFGGLQLKGWDENGISVFSYRQNENNL